MIRLRPSRLRSRLTLSYCLIFAIMLLVFIGTTSFLLYLHLKTQLGRFLVEDLETVEGLLEFDARGHLLLRENYHNHPESREIQERLLEVLNPEGRVLYRNERLANQSLDGIPFASEGLGGYSERSITLADGTPVLLASRRHVLDGHPLIIRVGYSQLPIRRTIKETITALLISLPAMLGLAGLAGYWLARRALQPLEQMALRAEQITPDRLHERLPVDESGELGHLAQVFNKTLGRLEQSFEQLKRFTSDASHELRTPLTAIRSVGEVGLQKNASREEYRDIIGSMLEEVNRLTRLIDNLLTISRADSGHLALNQTAFSAMSLIREAVELIEILADEKKQHVSIRGTSHDQLYGDRLFLRQALVNILDNAVKYSPEGGSISVSVESTGGRVVITVADSGPGIAAEHRPKVFERFYRVDKARSRNAGGAGLGLAIAQWAVRAHRGELTADQNKDGGCIFRMEFPRTPEVDRSTDHQEPSSGTKAMPAGYGSGQAVRS